MWSIINNYVPKVNGDIPPSLMVLLFDPRPKSYKKKSSVNIFVTGDDRKEPLRYKEPLVHTVNHYSFLNMVMGMVISVRGEHCLEVQIKSVFMFHYGK